MKTTSKLMAIAAAASLAIAPAAAQAGTRAASSAVDVSIDRASGPVDGQNELAGIKFIWIIAFLAAVAVFVAAVKGKSRGA